MTLPETDDDTRHEARARALVAAMTRAEKLAMVTAHYPVPMAPRSRPADALIAAGYIPGVERLGFPALKETDASLGVSNVLEMRPGDVATALPCGLAMGSTWDPDLLSRGGAMIGAEAKAKGFHVLLAGGVNLTRDAWNGRNFEYLGEDPLHSGLLGGGAIAGVQSNAMVSTIKHFALNPQETGRKVMSANMDEASLRESDLLAFQIAIETGRPWSVMCGYNRVNGEYASANHFLLTEVLRNDWDYKGWVMSDWGAVHETAGAALAGLDQESGQELDSEVFFGAALDDAIAAGEVPESRLDEMVHRIAYGAFASGVVDAPPVVAPIDYAANAAVAQEVAEKGSVLLKNAALLPLPKSGLTVAVIGGHASLGVLSGGGSSQVRSVGGAPLEIALTRGEASGFSRRTYHASAPLTALRDTAPACRFVYHDGTDAESAVAAAREADVALVFVEQWQSEAHDVETLSLPDQQDDLIAGVAAACPATVVILETGGPVVMPWIEEVAAVLAVWYPGQRGGEAIARLLFGDVNPSGRLPITFPENEAHLPRPAPPGFDIVNSLELGRLPGHPSVAYDIPRFDVDYIDGADAGYRWFHRQGITPLFPFGFGLSYTRFAYDDFEIVSGPEPMARLTVTNVGDRDGIDTPQIYVQFAGRNGQTHHLAGWSRVSLAPGERREVSIRLDPRLMAEYRVEDRAWVIDAAPRTFVLASDAQTALASQVVDLPERLLPS